MKLRSLCACGVALGIIALSNTLASAATATASLGVSATVSNNCTISTTPLAFGPYDPAGINASTNLDGTATVVIACTKGAAATIGLNPGSNASGSVRRMANGSVYLTYEVYKETARTSVWGNSGIDLYDAGTAPSSAAQTFTVYGRVAAGQTSATAGSYADTLTATVNF
jgi:spore coat protein U domain-containing protein, fimbrial subunit CupE1/2/3/6